MFACCSEAASLISRSKRSALIPSASSGFRILMTTGAPEAALVSEEHAGHSSAAELAVEGVGGAER